MMEDLVIDGGHIPEAADYEDIGGEVLSMVQRYNNKPHTHIPEETDRQTEQTEQPPKQVIWALYGVLSMAVSTLVWLWIKML